MNRLLLGLFALWVGGCHCGSSSRLDCSTPQKCASPACVNTGCNFDDAGKALPPKVLGAKPPKASRIVFAPIDIGDRQTIELDGSTEGLPTQCSHDALGTARFIRVTKPSTVSIVVESLNQLSLAVFRVDRLGKRRLESCIRGFSPKISSLEMRPGRWEFVVTGKGRAELLLQPSADAKKLTFTKAAQSEPVVLQGGDRIAFEFGAGGSDSPTPVCASNGQSYRARIRVDMPTQLSVSVPIDYGPIHLGIKAAGVTTPPHCAPPINQSLVKKLKAGEYELFIETPRSASELSTLPWQVKVTGSR